MKFISAERAIPVNRDISLPYEQALKLELAKGSLYFMGAKLHNSLPKHLRESQSGFKEKLKIHFK